MKALTLTQPWAQLVIDERKFFETRTWRTAHRGLLAIHAAKGWNAGDRDFAGEVGYVPGSLARGAVLGIVRVVSVDLAEYVARLVSKGERKLGDFGEGRWAWQVKVVEVFPEPIPARGAQGLWTWERPS